MRNNKRIIFYLILIILFVILSLLIGTQLLNNIEINFYREVTEHTSNIMTLLMKSFSYIGNTISVIIMCIALILFSKTRWKYGVVTSIGVIISCIINNILKVLFARERPNIIQLVKETNYSFPSGHAMINMTLYILLAILIYNNIKNKKSKYILIFVCILIPIIIGISRVYLGVHYITDVIAGWIAGLLIAVITYQIYIKTKNKEKQYETN